MNSDWGLMYAGRMTTNTRLVRTGNGLYFVSNNLRRRVVRPEDIPQGISIEDGDITGMDVGPRVPRSLLSDGWVNPPDNKQVMREIIVSRLEGRGIEFGAGSRPMPVPLGVEVAYVEPFQSEEQYARMHYADVVRPSHSCPIEDQHEIPDQSQDFVIAAHVIEHTPNPLKAIVESYRVLKPGGQLILVVPDKRRTFDRRRETTSIDHLIEDFEAPSRQRDFLNYLDFFTLAKNSDNPTRDAQEAWERGLDIHYHVWTPGTFMTMMGIVVDRLAPFSAVEVKNGVNDPQCLEFYMWARK